MNPKLKKVSVWSINKFFSLPVIIRDHGLAHRQKLTPRDQWFGWLCQNKFQGFRTITTKVTFLERDSIAEPEIKFNKIIPSAKFESGK